jgi:hypothetical protein
MIPALPALLSPMAPARLQARGTGLPRSCICLRLDHKPPNSGGSRWTVGDARANYSNNRYAVPLMLIMGVVVIATADSRKAMRLNVGRTIDTQGMGVVGSGRIKWAIAGAGHYRLRSMLATPDFVCLEESITRLLPRAGVVNDRARLLAAPCEYATACVSPPRRSAPWAMTASAQARSRRASRCCNTDRRLPCTACAPGGAG